MIDWTVTLEEDAQIGAAAKRAKVGSDYRPKLYDGDHLSIRAMGDCSRFYQPGGF